MLLTHTTLLLLVSSTNSQLSDSVLGDNPQVEFDYGTFNGNYNFRKVSSFLGMPFAKAGRFDNPVLINAQEKVSGVQDATRHGIACLQQQIVSSPLSADNANIGAILGALEQLAFATVSNQGEDCLTINVQIPGNINSTAGLSVMMWIFGPRIWSDFTCGAEELAAHCVSLHQLRHALNPNNHGLEEPSSWPTWGLQKKALFLYQESGLEIIEDDFREEQISFINQNADAYMY